VPLKFTFTGHITPEDKARSDYFYVPFDLPEPARRLSVEYGYSDRISADKTEGGNVIDIGIFDPRGIAFPGGQGFRGWSGSNRQAFTIASSQATPGYLPGPLPEGRYQIILGLYRIWPGGADYEIQIEAKPDTGSERAAGNIPVFSTPTMMNQVAQAQKARPPLWLRGDLQTHTHHSDGKGPLDLLVSKARTMGLDFVAITDHNTITSHALFPAQVTGGLVLIPGQEVTTYYGHLNVWGTSRWCDFRCRRDADMAAVIDLAHKSGALCSINHPGGGDLAWSYSTDLPVDSFEVWNGPWPNHNAENLALWDELLKSGRHLPAVGGSDYHCPDGEEVGFVRLGQPTTRVKAGGRSMAGILDAIRAGRACISAFPDGPRLDIYATTSSSSAEMGSVLPLHLGESAQVSVETIKAAGYSLRLLSEAGVIQETTITTSPETVRVNASAQRYLRAELVGDLSPDLLPADAPAGLDLREWRFAISNPIYIQSL
jgi:hypothetical protein